MCASKWDLQTNVHKETLLLVNVTQKNVMLISSSRSILVSAVRCYTTSCRVLLTAVDTPRIGDWAEPRAVGTLLRTVKSPVCN